MGFLEIQNSLLHWVLANLSISLPVSMLPGYARADNLFISDSIATLRTMHKMSY